MRRRHKATEDDEDEDDNLQPIKSPRLEKSPSINQTHNNNSLESQIGVVAGRLAKVELENFMCHGNLSVPMDVHRFNCFYIGGPNGSGKSALFSAINIGLGGTGRTNDRGNTVKTYIKNGKTSAKIRITLTNTGDGRAETLEGKELGDYVIIERVIKETGGSYAIKTTNGSGRNRSETLVSTKKVTLDLLLARYGIELTNPIYWLSQDKARSFLAATDSRKMYQIFMEASGLESTKENYEILRGQLNIIKSNLAALQSGLAAQKKEYQRRLELRQQGEKQEQKQSELIKLSWYAAYAPLRDAKEKEELLNVKSKTYDNKVKEFKSKIEEYAEGIRNARDELDNLATTVSETVKRAEAMRKHEQDYKDEMMPFITDERTLRGEINEGLRRIKMAEEEINKSRQQIKIEQRRISENVTRREKERMERDLMEFTEREVELTKRQERLLEEREALKEEIDSIQQQRDEANAKKRQTWGKRDHFGKEVKKLEDVQKNQELRFGPDTPKIIALLNKYAKEFTGGKPKGPVGRYVTVRDKKWSFAIEIALKDKLFTYIFGNERDQSFFRSLITQHGYQMPQTAITGSFGFNRYNTENKEPDQRYATILSMLEINDDDVANYLIDTAQIETIILIEQDQDARNLMNGHCPCNVRTAYTLNGAQVFGSNGTVGQYRFYQNNVRQVFNVLSKIDSGYVRNVRNNAEAANNEYQHHEDKFNEFGRVFQIAMDNYRKADRDAIDCENYLNKIRIDIKRTQREMAKLEDREDGDEIIQANERTIEVNMEKINSIKEDLAQKDSKYDAIKRKLVKMNKQLDLFKEQASAATKANKDEQEQVDILNEKIRDLTSASRMLEEKMKIAYESKEQLENEDRVAVMREIEDAELHAEAQKDVHNRTDEPNFEDIPDTVELHALIKKKNMELEAISRAVGTDLPSNEYLHTMKDAYKKAKSLFEDFKEIKEQLDNCYEIRQKKFPVIQHAIISRLRTEFQRLIKFKFEGEMIINPAKQEVKIMIKPHSNNPQECLKDIKGLSGGERSYTTTCFLMALWDIMETPFRCMDEFDVFMDGHMRKTAMDLIVKLATEHYSQQQFIFFTPQGINELKVGDRVATFEMPKVRDV